MGMQWRMFPPKKPIPLSPHFEYPKWSGRFEDILTIEEFWKYLKRHGLNHTPIDFDLLLPIAWVRYEETDSLWKYQSISWNECNTTIQGVLTYEYGPCIYIGKGVIPPLKRFYIAFLLGCWIFRRKTTGITSNEGMVYCCGPKFFYNKPATPFEYAPYRFAMEILLPAREVAKQYEKSNGNIGRIVYNLQVPFQLAEKRILELRLKKEN